ncbi:MAG TPA: DUF3596 domain-containing protein [Nevskia sp.]|nr:DUF3596 domain-containing protein [Nevskia sp.]
MLFFDFYYQRRRCREYTKLDDTPANRKRMQQVLNKVAAEITLGTFDYPRYFPNSKLAAQFASASSSAPGGKFGAGPLFRDFAATWRTEKGVEWRASYRATVDSILNTHLLPRFGEQPIAGIDREALLCFRAELRGDESNPDDMHAPATVNRIMGILRQIFDEASVRHSFPNPCSRIKRLKNPKQDIEPFTLEQVRLILAKVRADYRDYLTVRFFTGMRSGEAHGLKWKYVDFQRRQILVRETFSQNRTEYTKTDGSQREIDMSQPTFDALTRMRPAKPDPEAYVFHTREGGPIDNKNFTDRVWYPLLRHLDLKRRRPYQMRHTCATLWLAAGENPEWIARQLGHSTTEMLFRVYSRFVPNLTRRDGSAFERLLAAEGVGSPAAPTLPTGEAVHA